jgi:hypothetical protein
VFLWLLALIWWSRGRRGALTPEEAEARAAARAARHERRRTGDDDFESTVEFWESG